MIFVTLGTQDKPFNRLLELIQKEIDEKKITEEVIVQAGFTKFDSKDMKIFEYLSMDEFEKYINECDVLITHGGVGNILSALKLDKKVIAVPRLEKYGEHTNDHQLQIVEMFSEKKYILPLYENDKLSDVLKEIEAFKPNKWDFDNSKIINGIREYINNN